MKEKKSDKPFKAATAENTSAVLVEIFLPVANNQGRRFDDSLFADVREELTNQFGGMTSFARAPAQGVAENGGERVHDDIIVIEVMTEVLNRDWWNNYRRKLEERFRQDEILIRASEIVRL